MFYSFLLNSETVKNWFITKYAKAYLFPTKTAEDNLDLYIDDADKKFREVEKSPYKFHFLSINKVIFLHAFSIFLSYVSVSHCLTTLLPPA